jgi:hypothetical protein
VISDKARAFLSTLKDGLTLSTRELVIALDLGESERYTIARNLMLLATTELSDCAEHGEPQEATSGFNKGKMVRPWYWSKPHKPSLAEAKADREIAEKVREIVDASRETRQQMIDAANRNIAYTPTAEIK